MVRYRLNFVAGGMYFFTATLADRSSSALIDHIGALRGAVRARRASHPFAIDAVVVLPEHLHVVLSLPEGDANFSIRLSLIKRRFTEAVARAGVRIPHHPNGEYALWQRRFWEHTIRDDRDLSATWTISTSIPSNTGTSRAYETGRTRRFTAMCGRGCCPRIGPATSPNPAETLASDNTGPGFRCAQSGLRNHAL